MVSKRSTVSGPLSSAQVELYFENGFLIVEELFSRAEIAEVAAAFERLADRSVGHQGTVMIDGSQFVLSELPDPNRPGALGIKRVVWCGAAEPSLLRYGRDRRITECAAQLLGSATGDHLINQAHFKLPGDGVFFPFHQDSRHRRYGTEEWRDMNGTGSYVQIALAVDRVTTDNGPLLFIPGSGKKGHLDLPYDDNLETVSEHFDPSVAVPALMEPGSIALFGPYTIHGSLPNTSGKSRRVFINGFSYPGANSRVYPGEGAGASIQLSDLQA